MDMSADFYLETVEQVFQRYLLPQGLMKHRGRRVEPRAIKKTFLLTVEGEKDDICAVGQTLAAQDLCSGLRPYMKTHHLQAGVGHYGVFNGKRWESQVYPVAAQPHPVEPVGRPLAIGSGRGCGRASPSLPRAVFRKGRITPSDRACAARGRPRRTGRSRSRTGASRDR